MLSLGNNITSSSAIESKYSLNLDGTDDYLDTGHHFSTVFNDSFTISFWAKPFDGDETQSFFGFNDGDADIIRGEIKGSGDFKLTFKSNGAERTYQTNSVVFSDGQATSWTHILVTVTKSTNATVVVYKNGVSASIGAGGSVSETNHAAFSSAQNLAIGAFNSKGTVGGNFTGGIDEFAIWNVALDADAAAAVYNSGSPFNLNFNRGNYDNSPALQAYYRMGDGPNDDKENGIVHDAHNPGFGSEKLVNSDFSSSGDISTSSFSLGWIVTDDDNIGSSIAGGELILEHPDGAAADDPSRVWASTDGSSTNALTVGKVYKFTYTVSSVTGSTQLQYNHDVWYDLPETVGTHYVYWRQTTNQRFVLRNNGNNSTIKLSSISIVELNGFPGMTSGGPTFSSDAP